VLQKLKSKWRQSTSSSGSSSSSTGSKSSLDSFCMQAEWYKPLYNRAQSEEWLKSKEIGVFLIRTSESYQHTHVLSLKVPKYMNPAEIAHYLLVRDEKTNTYCVNGFNYKQFSDLSSLVTHCSLMRDILPVMLNLQFYQLDQVSSNGRECDFIYYFTSTTTSTTTSTSSLTSTISSESNFSDLSDDSVTQLFD
jgi:hypothetical protein